jgi:hypothetical protein
MKKIFLFGLLILFFYGCKEKITNTEVDNIEPLKNEVITKFQLLDSNNVAKTIFSEDEKLFMDILIRNELYKDLTYNFYGPPMMFEIWKNDSLFATNFDYIGFEIITETHTLKSEKEIKYKWLAPNSSGRYGMNDLIVLTPGIYVAKFNPNTPVFFNEQQVEIQPIEFEIIE